MPATIPFNTLDYARKLEAAGVPSAQAEVQATALNNALASSVASRDDLTDLGNNLDGNLASLEGRIDAKFADVDAKLAHVDARFDNVDIRFENLEVRLNTKIDTVKNELALELGGKIETLKWMFGVLVALNGATFVQLFLRH